MILRLMLLACCIAVAFRVQAQVNVDTLGTPNIGERLFLETRFAEYFFTNSGGNANFKLPQGDPDMNTTASIFGPLPGPFAGQSMNCRACHLVEEHESIGNRTYADFTTRSPIPNIGDGRTTTPRNAIPLVDSLLPRPTPLFLHFDAQFATPEDLVMGTMTGRNYGWKPAEYATAISHIAHIIREDDGSGSLAQQYGGWSYAQALAGLEQIQPQYLILPDYQLYDVTVTNTSDPFYVSDNQIVQDVAALVQAYLETLVFSQDTNGLFNGSPYDVFLIKNALPRAPATNETPIQYSQRLLGLITNLPNPQFLSDPADGHFTTHDQLFQFGPTELAGLEIFFTLGASPPSASATGTAGNCVACHTPPAFTDFLFHNTGAAQEEYDAIHGAGSFMALSVPGLRERQTNYDAYLPPTTNHPNATGSFITPPTLAQPGKVDLGLWNVFDNPDFPAPQAGLLQIAPLLAPPPKPQMSYASVAGANFVFSGSNGAPGWAFRVLTSTNLTQPPSNWIVIETNVFDAAGDFNFAAPIASNAERFYLLAVAPPTPDQALAGTMASFKTPNVRDLGSSEPYLHTGRMTTLESVISFYENFSSLARSNSVRNADPQLKGISLNDSAVAPLAAFLRALNEDYFDIPCPCQIPVVGPQVEPGNGH
jgi:hypothetical protein